MPTSCAICHCHLPDQSEEDLQVMLAEFRGNFGREPMPDEIALRLCDECYRRAMAHAELHGIGPDD